MKQLKFLMVAFTLMMGISLTSCMNSEPSESTWDWAGFMSINNYMGLISFTDMAGTTVYPTAESIAAMEARGVKVSDYNLGVVYIKNVETKTEKKTETYVKLVAFIPCQSKNANVVETEEEMKTIAPETAPIALLYLHDGVYSYSSPVLFNLNSVILPIAWYQENSKDKVKEHKFALVCRLDEVAVGDSKMVLYLRHDKGADDKVEANNSAFYSYNIRDAVERFVEKTGKTPTQLVIKTHETGQTSTNTIPDTYKEYSVNYKEFSKN